MPSTCVVTCDDEQLTLTGRRSVFSRVTDFAYLPRDASVNLRTVDGGRFALPSAKADRRLTFRFGAAEDVAVELRGAGAASRQVNNFCTPDRFDCDRLIACEVLTPGGNWSSYPPHKHDVHNPPGEVDLDEIYFYKISQPEGFAIQRVYTRDGRRNETLTVRNNEVVLIPDGYHPVVAAHGYDCYYLNVLAGSARSMAASDDPDLAWVRGKWNSKDPRLPLVR